MTQYVLEYELQSGLWNSLNANREVHAKAWWTAFRNELRALLPSPSWLVGDLFRWQGNTGRFGHGFIIRHTSAGEWLIAGSADGTDSTSSNTYFTSIFQNTSATYFLRDGSSPASLGSYFSGIMICYNEDPGTSWNIGYNSSLVLGSGDYTAPTANPFSNLAGFWTATKAPHGIAFVDNIFDYRTRQRFQLMFDDVQKMMRMDANGTDSTALSQRSAFGTKMVFLSGTGFGPNADLSTTGGVADPTDTNYGMNCLISFYNGASNLSAQSTQVGGLEMTNRCYVLNAAGARVSDVTLTTLKDLTLANFQALSGNLFYRLTEARSGTLLKGTVKNSIAVEACPYRDGTFSRQRMEIPTGSGNILVREHEALAMINPANLEPWPRSRTNAEIAALY